MAQALAYITPEPLPVPTSFTELRAYTCTVCTVQYSMCTLLLSLTNFTVLTPRPWASPSPPLLLYIPVSFPLYSIGNLNPKIGDRPRAARGKTGPGLRPFLPHRSGGSVGDFWGKWVGVGGRRGVVACTLALRQSMLRLLAEQWRRLCVS